MPGLAGVGSFVGADFAAPGGRADGGDLASANPFAVFEALNASVILFGRGSYATTIESRCRRYRAVSAEGEWAYNEQ